MIEDAVEDTLWPVVALWKVGYDVIWDSVQDAASMSAALSVPTWDVILCDHPMPRFHSVDALRLARRLAPEIPFLVYSDGLGEYRATELLAAGAREFFPKSDWQRLVEVIERALYETESLRHSTKSLWDFRCSRLSYWLAERLL